MMKRAVVAVLATLALSACGGEEKATEGATPEEVLAEAKTQLDEASSWRISLSTDAEPKSGNAVIAATGVGTHEPAWEGEVDAILAGIPVNVPIVAVDGKVHAKLPLTPTWSVINPAEYGAPNPADFMDTETGISALLADLQDPNKGSESRVGGQIVTTYTGTLPGDRVATIIPSAKKSAEYETEVGINDSGQVATVKVTGPFFAGGGDVTYDIRLSSYGEDVKITAP